MEYNSCILRYGPSCSGKSAQIIKEYYKNIQNNIPTVVIDCMHEYSGMQQNYKLSRQGNSVINHHIITNLLGEDVLTSPLFINAKVILIDETNGISNSNIQLFVAKCRMLKKQCIFYMNFFNDDLKLNEACKALIELGAVLEKIPCKCQIDNCGEDGFHTIIFNKKTGKALNKEQVFNNWEYYQQDDSFIEKIMCYTHCLQYKI